MSAYRYYFSLKLSCLLNKPLSSTQSLKEPFLKWVSNEHESREKSLSFSFDHQPSSFFIDSQVSVLISFEHVMFKFRRELATDGFARLLSDPCRLSWTLSNNHRQPKLTVCIYRRVARFINIRLCVGTLGSGNL